jgi:hypothetical protein
MFQENRNSLFNPEVQQKFFKYFKEAPTVLSLNQIHNFYNLLINPYLYNSQFYLKDGGAVLETGFFEFFGVEEKLKNILNVNPELFNKSENHLVLVTVYFDYKHKNNMSIYIDKQVMSTIYTNPPHGKVDYESVGLQNLLKKDYGGISALSLNPTRFTIKTFDELHAGFIIITESFQDSNNQTMLNYLTQRGEMETFKNKVRHIYNLKENNQLLPKYIVDYVEKERNYNIIKINAQQVLFENLKNKKIHLREEKPTMNLLNYYYHSSSHPLLYKNYSLTTVAALDPHVKMLHFIDLDSKNPYLDYKKKLSALQPVLHKGL